MSGIANTVVVLVDGIDLSVVLVASGTVVVFVCNCIVDVVEAAQLHVDTFADFGECLRDKHFPIFCRFGGVCLSLAF